MLLPSTSIAIFLALLPTVSLAAPDNALVMKAIQQSRQRQSSRSQIGNLPQSKPVSNQQQIRSVHQSKSIDVAALNALIQSFDKTWALPKVGGKEPVGSNFQYKKTCASIYKARPGACSQLGFGSMCFNYCHEKGEKVTYSCIDASDAAYCKSSSNFEAYLNKYRKDTYKAKAYVHQMISRCYATAICNSNSILDVANAETTTARTREMGHLKLTKPSNKLESTTRKARVTKTTTTTEAPEIPTEAVATTPRRRVPIWQKLLSKTTTTTMKTIEEEEEEEEERREEPSTTRLSVESEEAEVIEENLNEIEEEELISTTQRGPQRKAKPVPKTRATWKPLRLSTIAPSTPPTDVTAHTSEKSPKEETFWNRFQPNTWYQSIHYFTNTGR